MAIVPFRAGPAMANNLLGDPLPAAMDALGVLSSKRGWPAARAGRIKKTGFEGE